MLVLPAENVDGTPLEFYNDYVSPLNVFESAKTESFRENRLLTNNTVNDNDDRVELDVETQPDLLRIYSNS